MSLYTRRVGSSLVVLGHKLYKWRGDTAFTSRSEPESTIEVFDFTTGEWSTFETSPESEGWVWGPLECESIDMPESVTGCSMAGVGESTLYLFGGFGTMEREVYYRGLFKLDLNTWKWKKIEPINDYDGPMAKYLAGMVTLDDSRGLLLIFGGFGVMNKAQKRQRGADYLWSQEFSAVWTNELHIFDTRESVWIGIETTGMKPPPCAATSFTRIDRHRIVLFGGRQQKERVNELHILDTSSWHWSGPIMQPSPDKPWPSPRSLHTAVSLLDPFYVQPPSLTSSIESNTDTSDALFTKQNLLVLWGQDTDGEQLSHAWLLDTETMSWKNLYQRVLSCEGRKWHSSVAYYPSPYEAVVVTTGGFNRSEMMLFLDPNKPNPDTFYFKTGVCSLYQLCLQCISSIDDGSDVGKKRYSELVSPLPKHIQRHLLEFKVTEKQNKSIKLVDHGSKFCLD